MNLNQSAIARLRNAAAKGQSDLIQGVSHLCPFLPDGPLMSSLSHPGLGTESRRMLEEFGSAAATEPVDTADPQPTREDEQSWVTLEEEGIAQGFIDDIQGLINGK